VAGARAAYRQVIDSGHRDQAPLAALYLGLLLGEAGDVIERELPTSRPSIPATPTPPLTPLWALGSCSGTTEMWQGRGLPASGPSIPAIPKRPHGGRAPRHIAQQDG
jgi:hypothetical protein